MEIEEEINTNDKTNINNFLVNSFIKSYINPDLKFNLTIEQF